MTRRSDRRLVQHDPSIVPLMSKACEIVSQVEQRSTVIRKRAEDRIPVFEAHELCLGHIIGRGGFCVVSELKSINLDKNTTMRVNNLSNHDDNLDASSNSMYSDYECAGTPSSRREEFARWVSSSKKHKKCATNRPDRYVVKQVSDEIKRSRNKSELLKGTVDLCMEAKFLSSLSHPNIIQIRGVSYSNSAFKNEQMFVIMDCLKETFANKLKTWMHKERQTTGLTGFFTGSKKKVEKLRDDRLQAAYDIADAMSYLHGKNIIFRDLKPDNIGFDTCKNLKIFDFGLAKELKIEDRDEESGLYRLTGFTGALRYMAPEVGLRKPYDLKADVYSWSMLMWYILALEPPYAYFTMDMFIERVFKKGTRPAVRDAWPESLTTLLKTCWSSNIHKRPGFHQIKHVIRSELLLKDESHRTFESHPTSVPEDQGSGSGSGCDTQHEDVPQEGCEI